MKAPASLRAAAAAAALLAALPAFAAKKPLPPGTRIDVNRASVTELMRLPGVGEKRAKAIVERRQKQPFRRIEEVMALKGFGRAWFAKAKPNLVAGAPAAAPPARR